MSSEYYSLEKAAEVLALPTAEVNRLREKNQLRAFRDGSSWKFRKVDVDNYLAESIKNRGKNEKSVSDSDFDLLGMDDDEESPTLLADLPSFDSLMEDGVSFDNDGMVAAVPSSQPTTSKVTLDKNISGKKNEASVADDDLMLSADDLILSEDSEVLPDSVPSPVSKTSASDIDLAAGDDLVLDGGGSSGQLNLAGDSGLSLLDVADNADNIDLQPVEKSENDAQLELGDDDDILSLISDDLVVENTSTIAIPVEDDFQLTPDTGFASVADDSESASQVIALDEDNMYAAPDGSSGFGKADIPFAPAASPAVEETDHGSGFGTATPFVAEPGEFVARTPEISPATTETTYTSWHIFWIVFATVFLILPGMMILDLIIHIWSWGEPFVINSSIMDIFVGMWQG
ncbi:MAG: helix-turn-helix domain-containing protein [Planctomycetaceae bacterium]|jgi:excisionase family DNA binding protein|nr:helix-turn-helix domain-containing protein [Planctomycetaceae bacterium]